MEALNVNQHKTTPTVTELTFCMKIYGVSDEEVSKRNGEGSEVESVEYTRKVNGHQIAGFEVNIVLAFLQ